MKKNLVRNFYNPDQSEEPTNHNYSLAPFQSVFTDKYLRSLNEVSSKINKKINPRDKYFGANIVELLHIREPSKYTWEWSNTQKITQKSLFLIIFSTNFLNYLHNDTSYYEEKKVKT